MRPANRAPANGKTALCASGDHGRQNERAEYYYRPNAASLHLQTGGAVTLDSFDPEAMMDALLPLLGLTVTEESRAAAMMHLRIAAEFAQQLLALSFDDQEEPAPVFTP
jgi:hypothetical protein